ncbi:MAG TPA: winged helix-turn-helix domain-containing protein, partial [Gammaproteobacteria bacterium]
QKAATETPDIVVLDLGLPDKDGQDVLVELRSFYAGPIIVLSVRSSEAEKVRALDGGANDYVVKPFGVKEFLARLRGLLRMFTGVEPGSPAFNDGYLHVDIVERKVSVNGKDVHLSRKEFDLLRTLIGHAGRLVTQQQLLRDLWGPTHTKDTHYLRVFIAKLRSKIGDDPAEPKYLQTEPGVGYRFLGSAPGE